MRTVYVVAGGALLALGCFAALFLSLRSVSDDMGDILARLPSDVPANVRVSMQTKETSWEDEKCVTHKVTTTRNLGPPLESMAAWCARHDEAVRAMQDTYPPKQQ